MEITFQNRRSDLTAFYDYMLKQTQEGKQLGKQVFINRQIWLILILVTIYSLAWGVFSNLGFHLKNPLFTTPGLFFYLLMIVEGTVFLMLGFKPYYSSGREVLAHQEKQINERDLAIFHLPKTLVIDDDWLEIRYSEALHRWRWKLVDKIGHTPDFIFLHVGKCHTYYIPKRDFLSESDFVQFRDKLAELQKKNEEKAELVESRS